jgi:cephalosporin hydroxylase
MSLFVEESESLAFFELLEIMQRRIMDKTSYFGIPTYKNPIDFWVYQEIIFEQRPDVIIEIGNRFGGSTLALAHLLDNMFHGKIIGIDISHSNISSLVKAHPRIRLIEGDACSVYEQVKNLIHASESVLIIEDSAHSYEHTFDVLQKYSNLVSPGGYFIVEDGICHHGLNVGPSPGPYEACSDFILRSNDFEVDRSKESFCITWNPKGFLRRKNIENKLGKV